MVNNHFSPVVHPSISKIVLPYSSAVGIAEFPKDFQRRNKVIDMFWSDLREDFMFMGLYDLPSTFLPFLAEIGQNQPA